MKLSIWPSWLAFQLSARNSGFAGRFADGLYALHADQLARAVYIGILQIGILAGGAGRVVVTPEESAGTAYYRSFATFRTLAHSFNL